MVDNNLAKYLFLKIVQKANASSFQTCYITELVVCFEFELERVGSVLRFLGLADKSRGVWTPNFSLMSIIAKRLARQPKQRGKVKETADDRNFLARLYSLAVAYQPDASDKDNDGTNYPCAEDGEHGDDVDDGDDYDDGDDNDDDDHDDDYDKENSAANWCWNVLTVLGLLKKGEGTDGGFKPTPRLKRLFERVLEEHREERWGQSSKKLPTQSSNILYLNTTRDAEVSDKSSSPAVVVNETPLEPFPPPGVASASSIEGAAPTPGSSVHTLRAPAIAKPVLVLTTPLTRRATVPVPPFYSKRAGGRPFGSAAGEQADEQRGRLAIPAFRGQPAKVLRQHEPTKLSAKLPKLGNRKVQEKKAKRPSRDDLSDWW
jgi:hypothetical protein